MSVTRELIRLRYALLPLLFLFAVLIAGDACAQLAHHPFAVGANEGAVGRPSGFGAWLLAQESGFYRGLTGAVHEAKANGSAPFLLLGLSFAYGVFHAAGPGHGKAVIASYMVSNEVALRRGFGLALLAALLQGLVATAIVGIAAFIFDATAPRMTEAAQIVEVVSYVGIVAMGLALVWRKGRAIAAAWRTLPATAPLAFAMAEPAPRAAVLSPRPASTSRFYADDGHLHGPDCDCGHAHMPDPKLLERARVDWRAAGLAVVAAGARPCSGAILVLVFALSQGLFAWGVAAVFAMSFGTAITTGALATTAVFAKTIAIRISGRGTSRAAFVVRLVELAAAAAILGLGLVLLTAALSGVHRIG